jgi:hypothetical protein
MRLIDADALYEKTAEWEAQALAQTERYNPIDSRDEWLRWSFVLKERSAFKFDVADAPTIDAVPVIRCKDCKHYDIEIPSRCIKDRCYCATVDSFMKTTDYCSYGERKRDADMVQ